MSANYEDGPQSSFSSLPSRTHSTPQPKTAKQRFWRRTGRGVLWCLAVGVAAFCLTSLVASWQLNRELAAVVRRGEPLRLGKLVPPPLPELQNAAPIYLRAAEALMLTKSEEEGLRSTTNTLPTADVLTKNQTAIRLARQAAEIPGCRFPVDYDATNLAGILLPHLVKMRQLAYIMRAQAMWDARAGQTDAALRDVAALFRMSEHLAPEPMLLSGLTAVAIERMGYKTLAHVLDEVKLSPARAREFALRLPHTDWTAALHHDLLAERCFGLWAFQYASNPLDAKQLIDNPYALRSNIVRKGLGALWSPLWKMDEVHYLRVHERQSEALLKPGTPMISEDKLIGELPWYAICTRIMLPALSRVGHKRDALLAYRRMALVALALNAHCTTQGQYPASLAEAQTTWGTALPHDLYTQQSFLYKRKGKKALLYSVGPNRKDDGGKQTERTGDTSHDNSADVADDLVW